MALLRGGQEAVTAKPTVAELGIDPAAEAWHRSGHGDGAIEIAFVPATRGSVPQDRAEWVLMRVAGDPQRRVLVFDRHEWECFLDGARNGEFDDALPARLSSSSSSSSSSSPPLARLSLPVTGLAVTGASSRPGRSVP
jgi:Domain of unknown function (DUF397)